MILETERLLIRPWREDDERPMAAILGDPIGRRFHSEIPNLVQTRAMLKRFNKQSEKKGFSLAAVEHKSDGALMGAVGIAPIPQKVRKAIRDAPKIEIAWQIDRAVWGQGIAPEGAKAWLLHAWHHLKLPEIAAFTFEGNLPSRRVMEKIGMIRDLEGDFAHPNLSPDHRLAPHVLYRIKNPLS